MGIAGIDGEERLRPADWRDKYRWPDPDQGWSGPLAGYPPDHPIRAGRPIPLHLIAKRYQQDDEVVRYQKLGLIGSHIPEGTPAWTAPAGGDTPDPGASLPLINTPEEKARKLAIGDGLGIKRGSSLLVAPVVEGVTESAGKGKRRKKRVRDRAAYMKAYAARKRSEKAASKS